MPEAPPPHDGLAVVLDALAALEAVARKAAPEGADVSSSYNFNEARFTVYFWNLATPPRGIDAYADVLAAHDIAFEGLWYDALSTSEGARIDIYAPSPEDVAEDIFERMDAEAIAAFTVDGFRIPRPAPGWAHLGDREVAWEIRHRKADAAAPEGEA